jgi:cellulose synthase/poly-beta-1,6-N-acetylglucosamine synthase-like glycosyltransferase
MNEQQIILGLILALSAITASKYLIYIFTSPFYKFNKSKFLSASNGLSKKEIEQRIKLSVIVPAWNEEVGVVKGVESLLSGDYNNLEVIVVDDGSTDKTYKLVEQFAEKGAKKYLRTGKRLLYFKKPNGGKGSALNFGIVKASGDVIVTMDADTIFDKDALPTVARFFVNDTLDAAVGNVKVANSRSLLGIIQQIEYTVGFYFKRTHSIFNSEYIIGGAFGAFRKELFEKYGYFDEKNKTEDIELSTRLQVHGCTICFIEDAIAYTEGPSTISGLAKQRIRWKKGRLDTFIEHRELFFSKNKKHSKFLTHFLLPITLFYEIELVIEPFLTIFGAYYLYETHNATGFFLWIAFTGIINVIAFVFGSKKNSKIAFAFIPLYFLLSYVLTFIEVFAMYNSIKLLLVRKDVTWQTWNRKGISLQ